MSINKLSSFFFGVLFIGFNLKTVWNQICLDIFQTVFSRKTREREKKGQQNQTQNVIEDIFWNGAHSRWNNNYN